MKTYEFAITDSNKPSTGTIKEFVNGVQNLLFNANEDLADRSVIIVKGWENGPHLYPARQYGPYIFGPGDYWVMSIPGVNAPNGVIRIDSLQQQIKCPGFPAIVTVDDFEKAFLNYFNESRYWTTNERGSFADVSPDPNDNTTMNGANVTLCQMYPSSKWTRIGEMIIIRGRMQCTVTDADTDSAINLVVPLQPPTPDSQPGSIIGFLKVHDAGGTVIEGWIDLISSNYPQRSQFDNTLIAIFKWHAATQGVSQIDFFFVYNPTL